MDFKPLEHNTKHEFDSISNLKQHPKMDYPSHEGRVIGTTHFILELFLTTRLDNQPISGNAIATSQTKSRREIT